MEKWLRLLELVGAVAGILAFLDALVIRWKENQELAMAEMILGIGLVAGTVAAYFHVSPETASHPQGQMSAGTDRLCANSPCVFEEGIRFNGDFTALAMLVRNSGAQPALNFGIRALLVADNDFNPSALKEESLPPAPSSGVIAPGNSAATVLPLGDLTRAQLSAIRAGRVRSYILGQLQYEDGGGKKYFPRFCKIWDAEVGAWEDCAQNAFTAGQKP